MMSFTDWFEELKTNELFWVRMCEMHPRKNLVRVAEETHAWLVAREDTRDMQGCRSLFMSFARNSPDGTVILNKIEEKEVVKEWKPVSWQERAERLKQWQTQVNESPLLKPAYKPPSERMEEEGGVRPKATSFKRSEVETRLAAIEHAKTVRESRKRMFIEAFPDASDEEINAYVAKFKDTDDPNGILI